MDRSHTLDTKFQRAPVVDAPVLAQGPQYGLLDSTNKAQHLETLLREKAQVQEEIILKLTIQPMYVYLCS